MDTSGLGYKWYEDNFLFMVSKILSKMAADGVITGLRFFQQYPIWNESGDSHGYRLDALAMFKMEGDKLRALVFEVDEEGGNHSLWKDIFRGLVAIFTICIYYAPPFGRGLLFHHCHRT